MRNRAALAFLIAVSACSGGDDSSSGNAAAGLTALYEGGQAARRNQLCLIQRDGATRFGLIVWSGTSNNSCTGKGRATQQGERLSLAMEGDDTCVIEARVEGESISLPASLPEGCAYYCGPGVAMTGASFERSGNSPDDARRAVDLVGDPLCG